LTARYADHAAQVATALRKRGVFPTHVPAWTMQQAAARLELTRMLAGHVGGIMEFRLKLSHRQPRRMANLSPDAERLIAMLVELGLVASLPGHRYRARSARVTGYLRGRWLEELGWAAALAAGADAAVFGQRLRWRAGGFEGDNEIDVVALSGERLVFASCKAFMARKAHGAALDKLRRYLHEADDIGDHFGRPGDQVVLLTALDRIEEDGERHRHRHRYPTVEGKAVALGVRLLGQEDLAWERLVNAFRRLIRADI